MALMILHGPEGFVHPLMTAMPTSCVPEDPQGELQGGISAVTSAAKLLGTLFFAVLFWHFTAEGWVWQSPDVGYLVAGRCIALTTVMFAVLKRAEKA